MKRRVIAAALALVVGILGVFAYTQTLHFKDANLRASLVANTEINTNGDSIITKREAHQFTGTIDVSQQKIRDISGLENFENIEALNISDNFIESLAPIEGLVKLDRLDAGQNPIKTFGSFGQFVNLRQLDLSSTRLQAVPKDVFSLKNLERLTLSHNDIADIGGIENLSGLGFLDISFNQVTDISPVLELKNLDTFFAFENPIAADTNLEDFKWIDNIALDDLSSWQEYEYIETYWGIGNGIEIHDVNRTTANGKGLVILPQITGIMEPYALERLNTTITEAGQGLEAALETSANIHFEDAVNLYQIKVSYIVLYNDNNVLSLRLYGTGAFRDDASESHYLNLTKAMTFDLNTGKQLHLLDLLEKTPSVLECMEASVDTDTYALSEVFSTPNFSLNQTGFNLILDSDGDGYETHISDASDAASGASQDFETDGLVIPFAYVKDGLKLSRLIETDYQTKWLYDAPINKIRLLPFYSHVVQGGDKGVEADIEWSGTYAYPDFFPMQMAEKVESVYQSEIQKYLEIESLGNFMLRVDGEKYGDYYQICTSVIMHETPTPITVESSLIYDAEFNEVPHTSLLVDGYDADEAIRSAIRKRLEEVIYIVPDEIPLRGENVTLSVQLSETGFKIFYASSVTKGFDIWAQVDYADIGFENLKATWTFEDAPL